MQQKPGSSPRETPAQATGSIPEHWLSSVSMVQPLLLDLSGLEPAAAAARLRAVSHAIVRNTNLLIRGLDGQREIVELLAGQCLPPVLALDLAGNKLGPEDLEILACSPLFGSEQRPSPELDADGLALCRVSVAGRSGGHFSTRDELYTPEFGSLRLLCLADNQIGDAGARVLSRAPHLQQLIMINLANNEISDIGARALAARGRLPEVTVMDLSNNYIGDAGALAIAASPPARHSLKFLGNHTSVFGKAALATVQSTHVWQEPLSLRELRRGRELLRQAAALRKELTEKLDAPLAELGALSRRPGAFLQCLRVAERQLTAPSGNFENGLKLYGLLLRRARNNPPRLQLAIAALLTCIEDTLQREEQVAEAFGDVVSGRRPSQDGPALSRLSQELNTRIERILSFFTEQFTPTAPEFAQHVLDLFLGERLHDQRAHVLPSHLDWLLPLFKTTPADIGLNAILCRALRFGLREGERNELLDHVHKTLPSALYGLRTFLEALRGAADPEARNGLLNYVATMKELLRGHPFGKRGIALLERPLRLIMRNSPGNSLLQALSAARSRYPAIHREAFLPLYALADGDANLLDRFDAMYARDHEASARAELLQTLTACAYLPLRVHAEILADLRAGRAGDPLRALRLVEYLCEKAFCRHEQYADTAANRLCLHHEARPGGPRELLPQVRGTPAAEYELPPGEAPLAAESLARPPCAPISPETLARVSGAVLDWEQGRDVPELLESALQLPRDTVLGLQSHWGSLLPLAFFVRHVSSTRSRMLLRFLGQMAAQFDPPGYEGWKAWRYDVRDPVIAVQLAGLTPAQLTCWRKDHLWFFNGAPLAGFSSGDAHRVRYCGVVTDNPQLLFQVGHYPLGSRACIDYAADSHFARTLAAVVGDAHSKAYFTVDTEKLAQHAPELTEALRREQLEEAHLARHAQAFLAAAASRSIVKLAHAPGPVPLLQPLFSYGKQATVEFAEQVFGAFAGELADICGVADGRLAVGAPPDGHPEGPLCAATIAASRSPGGQGENYDLRPWAAAYHRAYRILVQIAEPGQNLGARLLHYRRSQRGV